MSRRTRKFRRFLDDACKMMFLAFLLGMTFIIVIFAVDLLMHVGMCDCG